MIIRVCVTILLLPSIALAGPGHQHGPSGEHLAPEQHSAESGGPITLSETAINSLGIETFTAKKVHSAPTRALYGKLVPHPKRVASIGAKFNGKVEKVYVIEGDYVGKGEELLKVQPVQIGSKPVVLTSSVAGHVTKMLVQRGEAFQQEEDLVEVSDLSSLLFRGELFDSTLVKHIQLGDECKVEISALSKRSFPCKIQIIDSTFRGTPPVLYIYGTLNNSNGVLKPNMTGKLHIEVEKSMLRILIPQEAVLGEFENKFVYVKESQTFTRKSVQVGSIQNDLIEVISGVEPGDEIVTQGHYQLQFAKSDIQDPKHSHEDHGHNHSQSSHDHSHGNGDEHDHKHKESTSHRH